MKTIYVSAFPDVTPRTRIPVAAGFVALLAGGGNGSLTVNVERECSWSARADAPWIALSGAGGQGAATLSYTVAPNVIGTPRRGGIVVGDGDQSGPVVEGQNGPGNGTVRLRVDSNNGSSRSATLNIAGKPCAFTQQGNR